MTLFFAVKDNIQEFQNIYCPSIATMTPAQVLPCTLILPPLRSTFISMASAIESPYGRAIHLSAHRRTPTQYTQFKATTHTKGTNEKNSAASSNLTVYRYSPMVAQRDWVSPTALAL